MRSLIVTLFILITLTGCIKEESTYQIWYFRNDSGVDISLLFFNRSLHDSYSVLKIEPNKKFQFDAETYRGKFNAPLLSSSFFYEIDSIAVIFNGSDSVLHAKDKSLHLGWSNVIDMSDNRFIGNLDKYTVEIESQSKNRIVYEMTYTFTEADYEFARE